MAYWILKVETMEMEMTVSEKGQVKNRDGFKIKILNLDSVKKCTEDRSLVKVDR